MDFFKQNFRQIIIVYAAVEVTRGILGNTGLTYIVVSYLRKYLGIQDQTLLLGISVLICFSVFSIFVYFWNTIATYASAQLFLWKMRKRNKGKLPFDNLIDFKRMKNVREKASTIQRLIELTPMIGDFAKMEEHLEFDDLMRKNARIGSTGNPADILEVKDTTNLSIYDDILSALPWPDLRQEIKSQFRRAVHYQPYVPDDKTIQPTSFFGGLPFAPSDLEWPQYTTSTGDTCYYNFIGQIDCGELSGLSGTGLLPRSGILYFFADHGDTNETIPAKTPLVRYRNDIEALQELRPAGQMSKNIHRDYEYPHKWVCEITDTTQPPGAISPKLPIKAHVYSQPPSENTFFPNNLSKLKELDETVLQQSGKSSEELIKEVLERLNAKAAAPFSMPSTGSKYRNWMPIEQTKQIVGYAGFPTHWLYVDRLMDAALTKFDKALKSAQNSEKETELTQESFETLEEFSHATKLQKNRKAKAAIILKDLQPLKSVTQSLTDRAQTVGLDTPLTQEEKAIFIDFWNTITALNERLVSIDGFKGFDLDHDLTLAAYFCALNALSLSNQSPHSLPENVVGFFRQEFSENQYEDPSMAKENKKFLTFGSPRGTQGNDDALADISLLQIGSDPTFDWSFGDANTLHYWISAEDLRNKNFEQAETTIG